MEALNRMSRKLSILVLAAILASPLPALAAGRVKTPTPEQAAQAERVLAIKRLQQQQMMREAFESETSAGSPAEAASIQQRRRFEEGARGSTGFSQRPANADIETIPAAQRGRAAMPLSATGGMSTLSYATNRLVNDVTLDTPARADAQGEPSIAAWGPYVMVGWNDGRGLLLPDASQGPPTLDHAMNYGYSTDGGQTFITGARSGASALPAPLLGGTWTSDPVIAVNEKTGEFYFCGLFDPVNAGGTDETGLAVARATFSGSTITWAPSNNPVIVTRWPGSTNKIDKSWMAVDSLTGYLYVTYTHFNYAAGSDSILFTRSTDKGLHWSPGVILSSPSSAGFVQGSRPAVGPDSTVYVVWKEIGITNSGQDYMRIRKSVNAGVTFGPEVTVASFFDNFGSGAPGFNREQSITLPSIAVDRSASATRGRVYVAWNESVNYYDSIPDTTGPVVNDTEPNDTDAAAQRITPGDEILGTFSNAVSNKNDKDYFKFNAVQGTTYLFYTNKFDGPYTMRIFATDGVTRLAFSGWRFDAPVRSFIAWTCPRDGDYFLRMANFADDELVHRYRVDTGIDAPGGPGQRARDHRDTFVAASAIWPSWNTPVNLSAPEPGWFDDWLPEVAVTGQGTVYALWYDFSDSPLSTSGGLSEAYMARSDNGGAAWASLGPVSETAVNWTNVNTNTIPNQGDYMALFANATNVYPVWTDTRFPVLGTPDVFSAPFAIGSLQVEIESVLADTSLVTIGWRARGTYPASAEVIRADGVGAYGAAALGTVVFDAGGRASFSDPGVLAATQYRYALRFTVGASTQIMGERTVVTPGHQRPEFAMLGAIPNPSKSSLRVRFTLPDNARASLRLYDIAGRPLKWVEYQGPGPYDVGFGQGLDLKPGLYFLKLSRAGKDIIRRVSVLP